MPKQAPLTQHDPVLVPLSVTPAFVSTMWEPRAKRLTRNSNVKNFFMLLEVMEV